MKKYLFYIVKYVKWVYALYFYLGTCTLWILKLFVRPDDKLILFISFGGKKYDDSPKVIYERMISDSRFNSYRFVWAFENPEAFVIPKGSKVKCDTLAYFVTALKARVWVSNSTVERGLSFKGKHTFYFDTWHGTPIKKMGTDIASTNNCFKGRGKWNVDYFTCQGEYEADIFRKVFQTIGKDRMHVIGLPRNDIYATYTREYMLSLRRKMGISEDKKVILYAPTFREYDKTDSMAVKISIPINFEKWRHLLGDGYILLFRAHYEVVQGLNIQDNDFVREMSAYPQLEDLMIVSDLLISDYSSIFFDYSIMHKPMLCFAYDYEHYTRERGLYFDIREYLPNAKDENELLLLIQQSDTTIKNKGVERFQKTFVTVFGNASRRSLDIIADNLESK
ncbi:MULTISPECIES: CDP-glycerol glycerophosphotransferase family protein [Parabacteroides]|uniref:CDP-glycerol glycerophosphotransferase family protein n=1 Tax=Bacteroidales TaxID=171549 RepID=UPI000FE26C22|nr:MULTISPECIES: CDP-glycerol glycerophosphotransferase family protein [Parabacteroides]RGY92114.1 CDP-glycerol--poly(glycerophosphate) glycerophosphotransferase [Parabacteroides sp. AM58-2XD]GKG75313.1 teichoic acid biosynthesis protein F [Parabacteroides goldsteinii]GKG81280.1 teichoic acid biosynthesis protein F [Parabacteroides goldsteinii]